MLTLNCGSLLVKKVMQLQVKTIPEWLQKLTVIDSLAIIDLLQRKGFCDCDRIPTEDIKFALAQWFKSLVDSIEADPDWWIEKHGLKHFTEHLPEPFEFEEIEDFTNL